MDIGILLIGGFILYVIIVAGVEKGMKNALVWYENEKKKNTFEGRKH